MPLWVWGALGSLALMLFGGSGVYDYLTVGEKQKITIEELIEGGPATGWYEISGAEWNEMVTLYQQDDKTMRYQSDGMLVLVRPEGSDGNAPVQVLLRQNSSEVARALRDTAALDRTVQTAQMYVDTQLANGEVVDEARIEDAVAASDELDAIYAGYNRTGTITGKVSRTVPSTWTKGEVLSTGNGLVDENFVTIDPDYEPEFWNSAGMLGGGILLALIIGFLMFRPKAPREDEEFF